MIVRELIARLGFQVDDKAFKRADSRFKSMGKAMQSAAGLIGAAVAARGALGMVRLASDAQETTNVLQESFGASARAVEEWSQTASKELGRSRFRMREMAGTLGALLNPMLDGNAEAAANMSTQLSALAVDLGSFFNASDDDALIALRAGLVGETEPLRRFGVNMLEAELAVFALDQGIRKSVKSMSQAEKTQLRFAYIMDRTGNAQGDAARTSQGYANATKRLKDKLRDVATTAGLSVLPHFERLVHWFNRALEPLEKWAQNSDNVKRAMMVLGVAAAALGLALLAPILPALVMAAAVGAVALAAEDVIAWLNGAESATGKFLDSMLGVGESEHVLNALKMAWADIEHTIKGAWLAMQDIGAWIKRNQKLLRLGLALVPGGTGGVISSAIDLFSGDDAAGAGPPRASRADSSRRRSSVSRRQAYLRSHGLLPSSVNAPGGGGGTGATAAAGDVHNNVTINAGSANAEEVARIVRRETRRQRNAAYRGAEG